MGSKLEKGIEGKKLERFGAQISVIKHQISKSQTHLSHLLFPFLFLFSSCLYRFKTCLPTEMPGISQNDRNRAVRPSIWGGTNHNSFCTGDGSGMKNSNHTSRHGTVRKWQPWSSHVHLFHFFSFLHFLLMVNIITY